MRKFTLFWSMLALFALALVPVNAQDDDMAMVRIGHFVPDAPAVDIYVDGVVTIENLEFSEVSPFLDLATGIYSVVITPTGTSFETAAIGALDVIVEADDALTVATVGSVEDDTLTVTVIEEDYSPIPAGSARITVVHAIEYESAIDLYGSSVQLVQTLRYPGINGSDGAFTRDVPVGRYNFEANISETDTTIRLANGTELADGEYYLIVALGPQANEGDLLIVTPEGYNLDDDMMEETTEDTSTEVMAEGVAMVRIGHFAPDAPAVDIYVDGVVAVEGLEFPEVTAFLELDSGIYSVAIAPTGTSLEDAVIAPSDIAVEADATLTVIAVGSVADETLSVAVIEEDYSPIPAGSTRITVVHAIEYESAIDLYGSGVQLVQSLRYPDVNGSDGAFTRDVPTGRYNFEANIAETDTTIRLGNGTELAEGEYYLIVALGPQANEGDLLIVTPEGYENE
ncbi:MAG: hypothetical protein Phog2KO_29490 [Phototrophicaceae bacterium]